MKILFTVIIAFVSTCCFSQNSDSSLLGTYKYPYLLLDTSAMSTYFLYDKAPHFINLNRYDGVRDTILTPHEFIQDYLEMINSRSRVFNMVNTDTIKNRMFRYEQQGINPLLVMNFKYNTIDFNAIANNLLDTNNNNQFTDVTARTSNPYNQSILFEACPAFMGRPDNNVKFLLASDLVFTDQPLPGAVTIDFGDGNGYVNVGWDQIINITYEDTAFKEIKIRYGTADENFLYGKGGNRGFAKTTTYNVDETVTATIQYGNHGFASGRIEVLWGLNPDGSSKDYGSDNNGHPNAPCYSKPLIFCEGIDFGYRTIPNTAPGRTKNGTTGLCDIIDGADFNYEKYVWEAFPAVAKGPTLINNLRKAGYDVIYLDYSDGAALMQNNAMVLIELIQKINRQKCTNEQLVVIGASMGGQVAKYALSYMEKNNLPHCVKLYVSYDSPQQGANITFGVQKFLDYNKDASADAKFAVDNKIRSVAAKQLLLNHFDVWGGGQDELRVIFMNELYGFTGSSLRGYPQKTRNIAVANGSKNMTSQGFSAGDGLIDMYVENYITYFMYIHESVTIKAQHVYAECGSNGVIFYAYNKFSHDHTDQAPDNCIAWDHAPGGKTDLLKSLCSSEFLVQLWTNVSITNNYDYSCFIPTISSLDILNNPDPFYNIGQIRDDKPVPSLYPFDAYYAPAGNQLHVEITDGTGGNIEWLMNQLNIMDNTFPTELPNANGNTYNYMGYAPKSMLHSITINNYGALNVNANQATEYGSGPLPIPGSTFKVASKNECMTTSASITVESGGNLILGDATPSGNNNKAEVTFKSGGSVNLFNGSTLTVNDNSKLIFESGATLNISGTPTINLNGNNSVIEIQDGAILNIASGATFTYSGSGYLKFNGGAGNSSITSGSGSIVVTGAGLSGGTSHTNKILEFAGTDNGSRIKFSGLQSFQVIGGLITSNCEAIFESSLTLTNITYTGGSNTCWNSVTMHDAISSSVFNCYYDPSSNLETCVDEFGYCNFTAASINAFFIPFVNIYTSTFTMADQGNGAVHLFATNQANLQSNTFIDNTVGIKAEYMSSDVTCGLSNFYKTTPHDNAASIGIDFHGNAGSVLKIDRTDILNMGSAGVKMTGGEIQARCSNITGDYYEPSGVAVNLSTDAMLTLDPAVTSNIGTLGNCDLSGYNNSILAQDAYDIFLYSAGTNLDNHHSAISGNILNQYYLSNTFNAQGNYWAMGSLPNRNDDWPDFFDCASQPFTDSRVDASGWLNSPPNISSSCQSGGGGCVECKTSNPHSTKIFDRADSIPFGSVLTLKDAVKAIFMYQIDTTYTDLASQLNFQEQVLKHNFGAYKNRAQPVLDLIYRRMQHSVSVGIKYGVIPRTSSSAYINKLISVQDTLLHRSASNDTNTRYILLRDKAMAYRLSNRHTSAISFLTQAHTLADSARKVNIEKWQCFIDQEIKLLNHTVTMKEFLTNVKHCGIPDSNSLGKRSLYENMTSNDNRIPDENPKTEITLYPNPAMDNLTIRISNLCDESLIKISIIDILGRVMNTQEFQATDKNVQFNIPLNLSSGTYFMRIESAELKAIRRFAVIK